MQLEGYLDVVGPDEIRLRGHRIGIEHVIEYFKTGYSPEQITEMFPGVALEQVYAAITYYLHRRADMDAYLERQQDRCEQRDPEWQLCGEEEGHRYVRTDHHDVSVGEVDQPHSPVDDRKAHGHECVYGTHREAADHRLEEPCHAGVTLPPLMMPIWV